MQARFRLGALLGSLLFGCGPATGELVPATAEEDARLPQLSLSVAGHRRALHLETFGTPDRPVLLVYHGGDGSDYRAMLPLQALSERYFVVMWDARGSGLSERISSSEVSEQSYADEVHEVKRHFSPDAPVALLGYSTGGFHAALAHYPSDFDQLALIEPDPFDAETRAKTELDVPVASEWANEYLWQNELLTPDDHALADYKLMSVSQAALAQLTCDPKQRAYYPIWRLGAKVRADVRRVFETYDFRPAVAAYAGEVLIVATRCGPQAADFQQRYVVPVFRRAELVELGDAIDHLNVFERGLEPLLHELKSFLRAYREEP